MKFYKKIKELFKKAKSIEDFPLVCSTLEIVFFYEEAYDLEHKDTPEEYKKFFEGINYECKEHVGGEGNGDAYYSVYRFWTDTEECYVKFDGWFQSYNGAEFEEMFEVKPVEKTITVYEEVK